MATPVIEVRGLTKHFGNIIALQDVSMTLLSGEVHCLLGDNGAGKSTLIRTLSGNYIPTAGEILFEGKQVAFRSPADALDLGIATVYQDLGLVPLMSVMRNFFMGREPVSNYGLFKWFRKAEARRLAHDEMMKIGIDVRDVEQPIGTMSGGERQSLAIARAVFFGARVLILDEPTSALGVAADLDGAALRGAAAQAGHRHHLHHPQRAPRPTRSASVHRAQPRPHARHVHARREDPRRARGNDGGGPRNGRPHRASVAGCAENSSRGRKHDSVTGAGAPAAAGHGRRRGDQPDRRQPPHRQPHGQPLRTRGRRVRHRRGARADVAAGRAWRRIGPTTRIRTCSPARAAGATAAISSR